MEPYPLRGVLALQTKGWGFHTVPGGMTDGGPCSCPVCWSCIGMEILLIEGWDLIHPGWRWLCQPRVGVSTPCGAVSTRGTIVFLPGSLVLWTHGKTDPEMEPYPPRGVLALQLRVGVSTPCLAV